jgi:hypothetical protein
VAFCLKKVEGTVGTLFRGNDRMPNIETVQKALFLGKLALIECRISKRCWRGIGVDRINRRTEVVSTTQ